MIVFLAKTSVVLFILWAFYRLFLAKESFFMVNRFYLLGCLVLTFVIPFITLPELINHQGVVHTLVEGTNGKTPIVLDGIRPVSGDMDDIAIPNVEVQPSNQGINVDKKMGFSFWLAMFYGFGVFVLTLHLVFQLVDILRKIGRSPDRIHDGKTIIINSDRVREPCSFFNFVFIDPKKHDQREYEQILVHEKIHVYQWHSIDLLLAEMITIVFWFNPVAWLFRKDVEKNLEYLTDDLVLRNSEIHPQEYQMNLLQIATAQKPLSITSNYNQSLIKKRIVMMNTKKSNPHKYWKYSFLAPVLFTILLVLNKPFSLAAQSDISVTVDVDLDVDVEEGELPALLSAVRHGDMQRVKTLVQRGANVNVMVRGDGTPLTNAITHKYFEIAEFLLNNGADPNLGTQADGYPLWLAAAANNMELIQLLADKGADVDQDYPGDGNAIIHAASNGNLAMVKTLQKMGAHIERGVKGDGNPLIIAAKGGHLEIVKYLVAEGADVNYEIIGDETPLINAAEQGHLEVVKFLVENGADVNKICTDTSVDPPRVRTALKMARKNGHKEVVDYLLSNGGVDR
ncbi:ankyrin repeat domain-containing protein [Ulvibacterium sp.]|uniref:ankyrin repeat domain-containing protein n=1 Tax=Ulvibacterium sp. TaxID=2665914 RepID=UPI003BABC263